MKRANYFKFFVSTVGPIVAMMMVPAFAVPLGPYAHFGIGGILVSLLGSGSALAGFYFMKSTRGFWKITSIASVVIMLALLCYTMWTYLHFLMRD